MGEQRRVQGAASAGHLVRPSRKAGGEEPEAVAVGAPGHHRAREARVWCAPRPPARRIWREGISISPARLVRCQRPARALRPPTMWPRTPLSLCASPHRPPRRANDGQGGKAVTRAQRTGGGAAVQAQERRSHRRRARRGFGQDQGGRWSPPLGTAVGGGGGRLTWRGRNTGRVEPAEAGEDLGGGAGRRGCLGETGGAAGRAEPQGDGGAEAGGCGQRPG